MSALKYLNGFGNHFATQALDGALPEGQNSPQNCAFGLYAEQFSETAFTVPRAHNQRTWFYRLRPSAAHLAYVPYVGAKFFKGSFDEVTSPNRLRWSPLELPVTPTDFVEGMMSLCGHNGMAIHLFAANHSMVNKSFLNADAQMLIVPQMGRLRLVSEMGVIEIEPHQIGVIPRGIHLRVELLDAHARGYVCENYGIEFRLPDLGPIGANGLANPRDFETPVAAFEDTDIDHLIVQKFQGNLWQTRLDHSPFDVVAWHGNCAPYRYDLRRFNVINSVSFDHPDPSIFTVLTSPTSVAGVANCDFAIFPPRHMVAEHTFRPPWFHRNIMSEFMGLIEGQYDAKGDGFAPGGASLHNQMSAHGPDYQSFDKASKAVLKPEKYEGTLAFMWESNQVFKPTKWAQSTHLLQSHYDECWKGFPKAILP